MISSTSNDFVLDKSCNLDSTEMDGTNDQNINTPLMFSCGDDPKDLTSINSYYICGPSIK